MLVSSPASRSVSVGVQARFPVWNRACAAAGRAKTTTRSVTKTIGLIMIAEPDAAKVRRVHHGGGSRVAGLFYTGWFAGCRARARHHRRVHGGAEARARC